MINLAVKVVVVAGFVAALDLQGEQRPAPGPTTPDLHRAASRTPQRGPAEPSRSETRPQAPEPQPSSAFAVEVMRLSSEADRVDSLWKVYKVDCSVRGDHQYAYGREWFSIWDHTAEPTRGAPACAGMLRRLLEAGEVIRRDLSRARVTAQDAAIGPGTEIGMLRWHSLDWPLVELPAGPGAG